MMRWGWMILGIFSGCLRPLFAQSLRPPLATAYAGFGAYGRESADLFSFTANPAALCSIPATSVGVWGERKYLLPELTQYQLALAMPLGPGALGLEGLLSGSLAFRETRMGLSYARSLGKKIDAGLSFGYQSVSIGDGYGQSGAITVRAGVRMHLTDRLHTGIAVCNPAGGKFGKWKEEQLSSLFCFGWGFKASEQFYLEAVIEKMPDQPVNLRIGWCYLPHPVIRVQAGIYTATGSGWIGAGYSMKQLRIDLNTMVHPRLGLSPGLLLIYQWKRKEKSAQKSGT